MLSNNMTTRSRMSEQDLELSSPGLTSSDSQQEIEEVSLGDELDLHLKKASLSPKDIETRHLIRDSVERAIRKTWPTATVKFYGSFSYGMSGRSSPLDIVIEGCTDMDNKFTRIISLLSETVVAKRIMQDTNEAMIRATARDSKTPVNLLFFQSTDGSEAELSSKKTREWIRKYPCLPAVVTCIRSLLINDDIHFITTYQLVVMFVCMCNNYEGFANDAGLMVVDFLDYFGQIFDFNHQVIAATATKPLVNHESRSPVVIIDPVTGMNISANLSQLEKVQIRSSLRRGLRNLNDWVQCSAIADSPLQALMGGSEPAF